MPASSVRRLSATLILLASVQAWAVTAAAAADPAMAGARRLRGFVEAFNSGEAGRMLAFYRENMTAEFQARRTDQEDRDLYERLRKMIRRFEGVRVEKRGNAEIALIGSTSGGEEAELIFQVDPEPPHLFKGYTVEIGRGGGAGALPPLDIPQGASPGDLARRIDGWLQGLAGDDRFAGSVLVALHGEPLLQEGYGLANRETGAPNEAGTLFDLGSITKMITKVAVGQLLRDGKLELDDTVLEHITDYPDREQGRKITVAHLLDHSSGLGDIFTGEFPARREEMIRPRDFFPLFTGKPLQFEPGQGRAYSNAGYVLLGALVEAASGMDYASYVEKRIFQPAGMTASGFLPRDGSVPGVAIPYTRRDTGPGEGDARPAPPGGGGDHGGESGGPRGGAGERTHAGEGHGGHGPAAGPPRSYADRLPVRGCPAGSSASTAGDLLKFYLALENGTLLGPRWTPWIFTGEPPSGPAQGQPPRAPEGGHSIGIAGGAPGVSTVLESGNGWVIIVLANMDPPVAGEVARKIQRATRSVEK